MQCLTNSPLLCGEGQQANVWTNIKFPSDGVPIFSDIYDDLISRRVNSSDAEKFADICPCPCNGVGWGVIWWVRWFTDWDNSPMSHTACVLCQTDWYFPDVLCWFAVCRGFISFIFLLAAVYLGLVSLSWQWPGSYPSNLFPTIFFPSWLWRYKSHFLQRFSTEYV